MKKIALLILVATLVFNLGATKAEAVNPNLKYFGYWNGSPDPLVSQSFNGIKNLSNSNIVMFPFGDSNNDIQYFRDRLEEIKLNGLKVILGTDFRFIEHLNGTLTFNDAEFERRYQIIEKTINGYEDIIYAFEWEEGNIGIENRFVDVTARLKKRFPNIGRMAVLAYPQVDGSDPMVWTPATSNLLSNLTDVGFDKYPYEYSRNSSIANYNEVKLYADKLSTLANNNQKLWFLPDTSVIGNCIGGTSFLETAIESYTDIANKNSRFVGMLGYLWNAYPADLTWGDPNNRNIDALALFNPLNQCYNAVLKQKHINIGKSITSTIDIIAPSKPAVTNLTGGTTQYVLNGTAETGSTIKIFDEFGVKYCQVITNSNGSYSCPFTVTSGSINKFKMFATDSSDNNSQLVRFGVNGNCSYSQLPVVGGDNNNWANKLNNYICQGVMVDTGANIGKLRSEITTDTGKVGIGTNNPSTPLAIVGLNEYPTEADAKTAGLKNGDLYRTGTQVKVVVGGDNIAEKPEIVNSDCGDNSTPNRLPIVGSDSNNWASILNHFLCNTMSNESGNEGKLKTNLQSISADGKVGVGTIPVGVANFAVKGLPNYTNLSTANNAGSKNGDIYQTNGSLQVVNSTLSSNITIANSDDCYQSTATTRLPKPGQDATTWGDILNNFLCRSHLNGVNNAGKLKTDLATIVQGGKIGIGTNNPTSVLAIPNLPEFTDNQQASLNIQVGSIYRTGTDVKVVY